jgi:mono/diheme cytochrome c family protein
MRRYALLAFAAACSSEAPRSEAPPTRLFDEHLVVPSDSDLELEIHGALEKKRREDRDRALDAREAGEQLEHATLSQLALDRQVFTLDDIFRVGDDLFAYLFRTEQGLGNGLAGHPDVLAGPLPAPNLRRVHSGDFGGPDAMGCVDCHAVGGDDGAGTHTQNPFFRGDGDHTRGSDERNAPALLGDGPQERVAAEMTDELAAQRAAASTTAALAGSPVTVSLTAKGLGFGTLIARADGTFDTAGVTGVSSDLVVRPFGWKGHQTTLRGIVKESFRIHMGVMPMSDQQDVRDGRVPAHVYGDGPWYDVDDDGATIEVEDGMVSTMVAYLSQLEVPIIQPPDDPVLLDRFARGRAVFDEVGCASCHTPALPLVDPILVTRAEQSEYQASPPVMIDVAHAGLLPKIEAVDLLGSAYTVRLFSDLRRHDMGPELAAPFDQSLSVGAIPAAQWLTRPLWGLADTPPYLHDGRAPTVEGAIRLHGGEGAAARDKFAALADEDRSAMLVFLLSLRRTQRVVIP